MAKKKKTKEPVWTPDDIFIWELMKAARRGARKAISNEKKKTEEK
jgi:hypothetical protein